MMHRIWSLPAEQRSAFDVSNLRFFHMASPMPPWLKQAWIDWLGPERIWELYGGTERQGATIINGVEWLTRRGSVGRIQGEDQLKIFNEQGSECKAGEVGEIFFKSAEGMARPITISALNPSNWRAVGNRSATWVGWTRRVTFISPTAEPI